MKIVEINGKKYVECYGKARGKSWATIYYPLEKYKIEAQRKPKTEREILEKKCDELWSKLVKDDWGNQCAICGRKKGLNSHHLITRSNKRFRWDVSNGICLCAEHHTLSSKISAHKTPDVFYKWLDENYPNYYNKMLINKMAKPQKQDMKAVYLYLKNWRKK